MPSSCAYVWTLIASDIGYFYRYILFIAYLKNCIWIAKACTLYKLGCLKIECCHEIWPSISVWSDKQGSYYQLVQYKYKIAIMYVSMLSNNKIKFIEVVRLPQPKMFPAFVWNIAISYLRHNLSCFPDIILEACGTHMFTNTKIISEAAFLFLKDIHCLRFKIVYATIILHLSAST